MLIIMVIVLLTMITMIVVASERLLAFLICYFSND